MLFVSTFLTSALGMQAKYNQPNIVLIVIDDMGQRDLSCYGSTFHQTPHIDQLAAEGVRFDHGYAACTVSSPSRSALLTGKYPARLHITDWIKGFDYPWAKLKDPEWCQHLPASETTIAEQLLSKGYQTWHVGKWHQGEDKADYPQHHGFEVNIGGNFKGSPNNKAPYKGYFSPYGLECMDDGKPGEYLTDRHTDDAIRLIEERNGDQPFFLNLWHYAVHMPLQGKPDKVEKYKALVDPKDHQQNAIYAAMVESVDESVGRIVAKLKEEGVFDNTLIIFTSDNGALEKVSSCYPFRHGKGERYEGGIRVPLIMAYGDKLASQITDQPAISMDVTATIQDVTRVKKTAIDGKSLVKLLDDNEMERPLYWHYPHYHQSGARPYSAIRVGNWKLIENFESGELMLYNLKEDISEKNNIAEQYPGKRDELHKKLSKWRKSVKAQYSTENENWDKEKERNPKY